MKIVDIIQESVQRDTSVVKLAEFAPDNSRGDDDDDDDIKLPYYDSIRKRAWVDGISKGKKQRFVNFRTLKKPRGTWAIIGDTIRDGPIEISHTTSEEIAKYLVSAYLIKNSK